jgi:capsular exopolysaccharide synthesis family protein
MERIKQALDKARAEREVSGQSAAATAPSNVPATAVETAIQYSQTKVMKPESATLQNNRVIYGEADRVGLTAYKMLRTQILQRMTARGWNTLGITSPAPEDGKTLTAINLAISLARELHHTVLLVDADLRNPNVHKYFGIHVSAGIGDYLLKGVPMEEVLVNPGIDRLVLMPGRAPVENSSEILASPAMGELVEQLKSRYPSRIVLFDLPPILSADDALSFTPFVDAFLMVLRDGETGREELEHAMDMMKDATIIGTVLNASDEKLSAYY